MALRTYQTQSTGMANEQVNAIEDVHVSLMYTKTQYMTIFSELLIE